jgi:type I restriction enzyme S subunit
VLTLLRRLRPVFAEIARDKQTTGLGHVTAADMKRLLVVRPDDRVLRAWDEVAGPLLEQAFVRERENGFLADLRDALLPRLLSGELRVASVDDAKTLLEVL